ncbi:HDR171Wp [Eremothecium sinecaudum]|uniref:HDR171Wp n=1 Tax=Eremothecium sinecaudum TaxID=45286 RepID=A0A120K2A3_9SACH|nr:HDR171Wp [Eremothecium sinecaudum]AMD20913.1 HDR171Wp [Eremothecium sinecaudum]
MKFFVKSLHKTTICQSPSHVADIHNPLDGLILMKSTPGAIFKYCKTLDAATLKKVAILVGADCSGTKPTIVAALEKQIKLLNPLLQTQKQQGHLSIAAMDMGIVNFAHCRLLWHKGAPPKLIDWQKQPLNEHINPNWTKAKKTSMEPYTMWKIAQSVTTQLRSEDTDLYLIERQRGRTAGRPNVPERILQVNILEHILFSNLMTISSNEKTPFYIRSSSPRKMVDYWCGILPEEVQRKVLEVHNTIGKRDGFSKKLRVCLVRSLLAKQFENNDSSSLKMQLSDTMYKLFEKHSENISTFDISHTLNPKTYKYKKLQKNDDLADALLHGLSWVDWINNFSRIEDFTEQNPDWSNSTSATEFATLINSLHEERVEHGKKSLTVLPY